MPELPEVETIVRDLQDVLPGESFLGIKSFFEGAVFPGVKEFEGIRGRKVAAVGRRGKFILIEFDGDRVLVMHLRMSGRILLRNLKDPALPYERNRLDFERSSLRFCDQRKFGKIWLCTKSDYEEVSGINRLGIEPFNSVFDEEYFANLIGGLRGSIKKNLLDQRKVAGIGNIYADEACFYAGIRPDRETSDLKRPELNRLFESVKKALNQGIMNRGTSISDYQDAYGKNGTNQELLFVYGRGGKECFNCKGILERTKVAGRGTVYCKSCQR